MGKQIHEIKIFDKGISSTASEAGIGVEYSSTSINVDSRARLGFLSSTNKSGDSGHQLIASDMITIKDKKLGTILIGFQSTQNLSDSGFPIGILGILEDLYGDNT